MFRSLALAGVTAVASAALAFAAAPAFAATDTAPVAGTQVCTDLVNNQANVEQAQTRLQTATNKLNTDLRANPVQDATVAADRIALSQAQSNLNNVVTNVTASLCTGTTTTPAPTPAPTTSPATSGAQTPVPFVPHTSTEAAIDNETAALSCASSNTELQRIDRAIAARQAAHLPVREAVNHLNAKLASLHCTSGAVTPQAAVQTAKDCGCVTTTPTGSIVINEQQAPTAGTSGNSVASSKAVIPTQSDNSVATTSGNQVTDVPAGSAQTGSE